MPSPRLGSVVGVHSTYYYSHGVEVQQDVFSSGTFMTRRHEDLASAVLCSAAYCQAPQRVRTISTVSPNLSIKNNHEFETLLRQVNIVKKQKKKKHHRIYNLQKLYPVSIKINRLHVDSKSMVQRLIFLEPCCFWIPLYGLLRAKSAQKKLPNVP